MSFLSVNVKAVTPELVRPGLNPTADAANATPLKTQLDAVAGEQGANFGEAVDPRIIVVNVIKIVLGCLGLIFTFLIIYAGFLMMTSNGEEEKMKKGSTVIRTAVIGLLIILSAYAITMIAERIASGDAERRGNYIDVDKPIDNNPDPLS